MKNPGKFALEIAVTLVVAYLLSLILLVVLNWTLGNIVVANNVSTGPEWSTTVSAISNIIFGLIVGYKLNDLLRQYKKK